MIKTVDPSGVIAQFGGLLQTGDFVALAFLYNLGDCIGLPDGRDLQVDGMALRCKLQSVSSPPGTKTIDGVLRVDPSKQFWRTAQICHRPQDVVSRPWTLRCRFAARLRRAIIVR